MAEISPGKHGILWREWKRCRDPLWRSRLFELVADGPTGLGVALTIGAAWAGIAALSTAALVAIEACGGRVVGPGFGDVWLRAAAATPTAAIAAAAIAGVSLPLVRRGLGVPLRWRAWLRRIDPGARASSLVFSSDVALHHSAHRLALPVAVALVFVTLYNESLPPLTAPVAWAGLGGVAVAAAVVAGRVGVLLAPPVVLPFVWYGADWLAIAQSWGPDGRWAAWLAGAAATCAGAWAGAALRGRRVSEPVWRWLAFWWQGRAPARTVLATVHELPGGSWAALRRHMEADRETDALIGRLSRSPDRYGQQLLYGDWAAKITRTELLTRRGAPAADALLAVADGHPRRRVRRQARWILRAIADRSRDELLPRLDRIVCAACFARFGPHRLGPRGPRVYGCRRCGQGVRTLACERGVALVLHADLESAWAHVRRKLAVRWRPGEPLPDFDEVWVGRASDADVEALAIAIGNHPERGLRDRAGRARWQVSHRHSLSDNSAAVLARVLGERADPPPGPAPERRRPASPAGEAARARMSAPG